MKYFNKIITVCFLVITTVFWSCSETETYKSFVKDGEISYTGKMDSLKILPGKNRVLLKGLIISDPKVSEVRAYWNNKKDSVVFPINRTQGTNTVSEFISNLTENIYNFEVRTFDNEGNKSISQTKTVKVYGERYQNSLYNRPISKMSLVGNNLTLIFGGMDLTTGVTKSEIEYTNTSGVTSTKVINITESTLIIADFKVGTSFKYRTMFLPETTAIDNFYTDYQSIIPPTVPVLLNSKVPFQSTGANRSRSTAFGNLDNWITNAAAKNTPGGFGGFQNANGGVMELEAGFNGFPGVTNGKIYQVVQADPQSYRVSANVSTTNFDNTMSVYIVVAKGNVMPDITNISSTNPNVLGFTKINGIAKFNVDFTVATKSDICIGLVYNLPNSPGHWMFITSWDIVAK